MQNKGCLVSLLGIGALCALLLFGTIGLFVPNFIPHKPFDSRPVTVITGTDGNVEVYNSDAEHAINMTLMSKSSGMVWGKVILLCFPLGFIVAIVCVGLLLWNRRKPRSCCASADRDDTNEIQQMYAGFKRMEQRLQTLETILTDKR